MLQLSSAQVSVFSGVFTLGSVNFVISADTLEVCRGCPLVQPASMLLPLQMTAGGYRSQSLYSKAILLAAGLVAGDTVRKGLQVVIGIIRASQLSFIMIVVDRLPLYLC